MRCFLPEDSIDTDRGLTTLSCDDVLKLSVLPTFPQLRFQRIQNYSRLIIIECSSIRGL